jgi:hypothetical protein
MAYNKGILFSFFWNRPKTLFFSFIRKCCCVYRLSSYSETKSAYMYLAKTLTINSRVEILVGVCVFECGGVYVCECVCVLCV